MGTNSSLDQDQAAERGGNGGFRVDKRVLRQQTS